MDEMREMETRPEGLRKSAISSPSTPVGREALSSSEQASEVQQRLRNSEARLRAIVDTAVDGLITIDERGVIDWLNPAAERLFGYSADELLGKNVKLLMPEPYHSEHDVYLDNYLRTGVARVIGIGREVVGRRKDGRTFPMDLSVSEVPIDSQGRLFTGIVRDISQRKAVETELRAAKDAAEAGSRAKDHFLAVLSHELRTPLTPVLAAVSQMMKQAAGLPQQFLEDLELIKRNVEMEARLIGDLLDVTRITRNKIELHFEVVDLHATARHVVQTCQAAIDSKRLELAIGLRATHHHVWADPGRIEQVLLNLLQNAIKFTPEGGSIALRTSDDPAGRSIAFTVSDTGIGIDAAVLPRLFVAFEQGEQTAARRLGGLGLGLSIAKALVDMQQGTISAHSDGPGRGARFTVTMPSLALPGTSPSSSPPQHPDRAVNDRRQASTGSRSVLLVEDHVDTRAVMAKLLAAMGYAVETAASVKEAIHKIDAQPFDLLLSDIGLPDGSGTQVMAYLKTRQKTRGVALSGFGHDEDLRRSREAGFATHLVKPIDFGTLERTLRSVAACGSDGSPQLP